MASKTLLPLLLTMKSVNKVCSTSFREKIASVPTIQSEKNMKDFQKCEGMSSGPTPQGAELHWFEEILESKEGCTEQAGAGRCS